MFQAYAGMTNYTTGAAIYAYADGAAWTSNSVPSYLSFHTATSGSASTTEKMVIKNNGNVGIGTTSPGSKLQVNGSTSDTSAHTLIARNSSNTSLFSIRNDGRVDVPGAAVFATSVQSPFFTSDGGRGFKQDSVAFCRHIFKWF